MVAGKHPKVGYLRSLHLTQHLAPSPGVGLGGLFVALGPWRSASWLDVLSLRHLSQLSNHTFLVRVFNRIFCVLVSMQHVGEGRALKYMFAFSFPSSRARLIRYQKLVRQA